MILGHPTWSGGKRGLQNLSLEVIALESPSHDTNRGLVLGSIEEQLPFLLREFAVVIVLGWALGGQEDGIAFTTIPHAKAPKGGLTQTHVQPKNGRPFGLGIPLLSHKGAGGDKPIDGVVTPPVLHRN